MMKYTKNNLKKLEVIFEEIGYELRYERGSFKAGYCLVNQQKVAIVNKFATPEGKLNCLVEILQNLQPNPDTLSDKSQEVLKKLDINHEVLKR